MFVSNLDRIWDIENIPGKKKIMLVLQLSVTPNLWLNAKLCSEEKRYIVV